MRYRVSPHQGRSDSKTQSAPAGVHLLSCTLSANARAFCDYARSLRCLQKDAPDKLNQRASCSIEIQDKNLTHRGACVLDEERPSITAEGAAVMRALHQTLDGEPKILDDSISPRLVDALAISIGSVSNSWSICLCPLGLRLKATFVMHSRYAEDCLAGSVADGVRQYVVLGASLTLSHTFPRT